jgi:hypothetical protein
MTLRRWHPADTPTRPRMAKPIASRPTPGQSAYRRRAAGLRARIEWPRGRQTATLAAGTVRVASRSWARHRDKEQAQILTSAPSP